MTRLAAGLALVAGVAAVAPATASAAGCGARTTAQAFAPFGDAGDYFLAPGGSFEPGGDDWSLTRGAKVASGNEPWNAFGAGASSLSLPPASVASSPAFCIAPGEGLLRFFVKRPGDANASLHVEVTATLSTGDQATSSFDVDGATAGWTASQPLAIPMICGTASTETVTVRITNNGDPATFVVDDVSIDPFKNG
jgi:hypothetical protein